MNQKRRERGQPRPQVPRRWHWIARTWLSALRAAGSHVKYARHPPWGIIADDLTGATDVAAAFANSGFASVVVLNRRRPAVPTAQAIVLTSNSRHDPPAAARRKVRRAFDWLKRHKISLIYKKLDSTWKGNIAVEITALRKAAGMVSVLVCPANPAHGRIVRNTILNVGGQDIANLSDSFTRRSRQDFALVRQPITAGKVERQIHGRHRFIIADASTAPDLACLAAAIVRTRSQALLAGSAALAAELAKLLARQRGWRPGSRERVLPTRSVRSSSLSSSPAKARLKSGTLSKATPLPAAVSANTLPGLSTKPLAGTLILAGSRNPVTQNQIDWLRRRGKARIFELQAHELDAVQACVATGGIAVLRIPVHSQPDRALLRKLAAFDSLFRQRLIANLLITGGDTACLVCRWLGVQAIHVHGEIIQGLAWGRIIGGLANELAVGTKPGGFGEVNALQQAVEFFGRSGNFHSEA